MTGRRAVFGWLVVAVLLTSVTFAEQAARSGLDDPRPQRQRPGVLAPANEAPGAVPVSDGIPGPGRRALILFVRPEQFRELAVALGPKAVPVDVDVAIVLPARPDNPLVPAPVGFDTDGMLASAYGMPQPIDGGPPVGYALVDSNGKVRYATLDPGVAERFAEIRTLLSAIP